jgi:fructose-1,6-bisphosphatase/inositol monophosphatase family enzyme
MLGSASMDGTAIAEGRFHVRSQHSLPPWDELPAAALVLGAGGAVRRVEGGGVTWSLAGTPTAVDDAARLLGG